MVAMAVGRAEQREAKARKALVYRTDECADLRRPFTDHQRVDVAGVRSPVVLATLRGIWTAISCARHEYRRQFTVALSSANDLAALPEKNDPHVDFTSCSNRST